MKTSNALRLALALMLVSGSTARADGPADDAEQAVLSVIDAARAEAGVTPLHRDAQLDQAALAHAEDMAEHGFVGHESQTSGDPVARVQAVGFVSTRVGENVARAATPAEAAHRMYASTAHHDQMVASEFTDVGVAVVEGEDGYYVVEVFAARPAPSMPAPASADVPPPVAAAVAASDEDSDPGEAMDFAFSMPVQANAQVAQPQQFAQTAQPIAQPVAQPMQAAPQVSTYAQAAGAPPTLVLQVAPASNVQGYWVQHQGAWWYYAIPAGARPGMVLSAVPGGQGPSNVGTQQLPVTAQPGANGGPVQNYYAQPYAAAQPYAVAPTYAAAPTYATSVVRQPVYAPAPVVVAPRYPVAPAVRGRVVVGLGLGMLRSPRRFY